MTTWARWLTSNNCTRRSSSGTQGQRTLTYQCVNDFHQELVAPAAAPAFHDEAHSPVGVLLEDREGEAVQPGDVRPQHALPDSRVVLAERHVEGPMARVLHRPVASHRAGEQRHAHRQTAEVVTDLEALLTPLHAPRRHYADRLQGLPPGLARQALGSRH